jgi:hypothetical protein
MSTDAIPPLPVLIPVGGELAPQLAELAELTSPPAGANTMGAKALSKIQDSPEWGAPMYEESPVWGARPTPAKVSPNVRTLKDSPDWSAPAPAPN